MDEKLDIITIGESLIELSSDTKLSSADCLLKYYGGDAISAAIAAQRLGSKVGFITRVGNDVFKDYLLDSWQNEGLDISQVKISSEPNGLYFIARPVVTSTETQNPDSSQNQNITCYKEKEFAFYRRKIAPSKLSLDDISEDYIKNTKVVYASGVTQSLSLSASEAVSSAFKIAKENDIMTAYDPNFSSLITTPDNAKEEFNKVISNVDVLFMSAKYDTTNILELTSVENIIKHLWDSGVSIVVIKASEKGGYYTGYNGNIIFTEFYTHDVVDTTCSGDVFNGGFLHALTHGFTPFESAKLASIAAGLQAKSIGAIKSIPYKDVVYSIYRKGGENA